MSKTLSMQRDLDDDLKINPNKLDAELFKLPGQIQYYTDLTAEARREYDIARETANQQYALVSREVRRLPGKFGITEDKITENMVKHAVELDARVKRASSKAIDARFNFESLQGIVKAFETKKKALEDYVKLIGIGYFAEARFRAETRSVMDEEKVTGESRQRVLSKMNRRGV